MQTGHQLCHLFVTILKDCSPADPRALWDSFWQHICDDLKCHVQLLNNNAEPSEAQIQDYGLYLIDQLLAQSGKKASRLGLHATGGGKLERNGEKPEPSHCRAAPV